MGRRRRRIWIPKYEGLEAILREQLGGERELRLLTSRLTGAVKAMETIARTPELLNQWRQRPFIPTDGIPDYAREAIEGMINGFLASGEHEDAQPRPSPPATAGPVRARPDGDGAIQRLRIDGFSVVAGRDRRQADGVPLGQHDGHAAGARNDRPEAAPARATKAATIAAGRQTLRLVRPRTRERSK